MSTKTQPFVFDKNYDNHDQVLPYYPEYVEVREALDAEGKYPYNDRFKGKIASLSGSTDKDEDTAIYLLQGMHTRNQEAEREAEFIASGGRPLEEFDMNSEPYLNKGRRGTLVLRSRYVGGTGYDVYEDVRMITRNTGEFSVNRKTGEREERIAVLIKKPRQREWRAFGNTPGYFLFREN